MKPKKQELKQIEYRSIKIKEEHYLLVKAHKQSTGVNIEFFIGQAIIEKLQKENSKPTNLNNA